MCEHLWTSINVSTVPFLRIGSSAAATCSHRLPIFIVGSVVTILDLFLFKKNEPGGRGDSHIKREGMLVVSLRGVDFGFWSHLGCSGQNAIKCSREGLL